MYLGDYNFSSCLRYVANVKIRLYKTKFLTENYCQMQHFYFIFALKVAKVMFFAWSGGGEGC